MSATKKEPTDVYFSWLPQRLEKHLSGGNSNGQIGKMKEWEFQLLSGKG